MYEVAFPLAAFHASVTVDRPTEAVNPLGAPGEVAHEPADKVTTT